MVSMLQLVLWMLLLQQALSQSSHINISEITTTTLVSRKVIEVDGNQGKDQCTLEYKKFKNSYLRFVSRPNYKGYITDYPGCFLKCCIERLFCRSFSYFPDTSQCFLMNLTRHDSGIVMAYSKGHVHVEITNPRRTSGSNDVQSVVSGKEARESLAWNITTPSTPQMGDYSQSSVPTIQVDEGATRMLTAYGISPTTSENPASESTVRYPIISDINTPKLISRNHEESYEQFTASTVSAIAPKSTTRQDDTQSGDGSSEKIVEVTAADYGDTSRNYIPAHKQTSGRILSTAAANSPPIITTIKPRFTSTRSPNMPTSLSPTRSAEVEASTVASHPKPVYSRGTRYSSTIRPLITVFSLSSSTQQRKTTPINSRLSSSTSISVTQSLPGTTLPDSETSKTTTSRYLNESPALSTLGTRRLRPTDTKRTYPTTKEQDKNSAKSTNVARIFTRLIKRKKKTGSPNNPLQGRMDKLTSCGLDCKNGGKCKVYHKFERTFLCQCKPGFDGKLCEKSVVSSKRGFSRISWWIILLIVVAIILFITVIGTFLIFYIYKRKVGNYNLSKDRRFELASAYSPDRIDRGLGSQYASLAWQNRPIPSSRATDDGNKSWIFCYFDGETRCNSIYRMRTSV